MSSADNRDWVLGMFAKWPTPGCVKSRLAAETSPHWAATVARAFLLDLLERCAALPVRRILAFTPIEAESAFAQLARGHFELFPQVTGDLGERLASFLRDRFTEGARRVVLVGTDSPTLPPEFLQQAFSALERAKVVIGPAADGGYYLIGCTHYMPELFSDITWSGPRVLLDTVNRVRALGLRLAVLPPWYDVDTLADWWMLRGHLAAQRQTGVDPQVPNTEQIEPYLA